MAREDMIRQDMQLVGTYNAIFEPTIKQLAKTERELSRAEKEWKKQGGQRICTMVNKTGAEYTAKSPYWTAVEDLRATVQALRNLYRMEGRRMRTRKLELGTRNLIGARVTQLRLARGMKQVELLAQLQLRGVDLSIPALSLLEGQRRPVSDIELYALAEILGVSADELLGRTSV